MEYLNLVILYKQSKFILSICMFPILAISAISLNQTDTTQFLCRHT
uniref:Uncharacterized protein n=1 Tax=Arundo donax TaxID=35708 RepID=A0A0A9A829_ARUDO